MNTKDAIDLAIECLQREFGNHEDNYNRAKLNNGKYRDEQYIKSQQIIMQLITDAIVELMRLEERIKNK